MSKKRSDNRLQNIKTVFELAKEGLTGIGIPGVEPIAGIPLLIIGYYETIKANDEAVIELVESLETLNKSILKPVNDAKGQGQLSVPDELASRIKRLETELNVLSGTLVPYTSLSMIGKLSKRGAISSALGNVAKGIDQAIRRFQLEGSITAELLLGDLGKRFDAAEVRNNLGRLKCADGASWNPKRTCLPGTREELLNEIMKFVSAEDPTSPYRIHLLVGVVGCGKSTIAQSVSDKCANRDPSCLASSFLFSHEVDARRTPDLLFSTIASNLGRFHPALAEAVSTAIESDPNVLSPPLIKQFRNLVLAPITSMAGLHPVTIVIDALDEGFNEELLEILADDFAQLPPNCRIVITSRPDPTVMMHLRGQPHILIRELDLADKHNIDDVAVFARHTLSDIAKKRGLGAEWPGEERSEAFIRKAEGLFIWVSTVGGFLRSCADPAKQLQRLIEDHQYFNLNSEAKMASLYATVLAACPWDDDDDFSSNYQLLMGTIVALKTPLSPLAIKSLLAIDISITDTLRSLSPVLMGVIDLGDGERPLQILHDSFREFATRRDVKNLPDNEQRYAIDEAEHNQRLTLAILHHLNRELDPLLPEVRRHYSKESLMEGSREIPSLGSISPSVWYSCRYLVSHLAKVTEPQAPLLDALQTFLDLFVVAWITLCASKGSYQELSQLLACPVVVAYKLRLPDEMVATMDLTICLLMTWLQHMGRREEALLANLDWAHIRRQIVQDTPGTSTSDLAESLRCLSASQHVLGHYKEAMDASRESEALYRQRVVDGGLPFTDSYGMMRALWHLSDALSSLGLHEEALATSHECVAWARSVVTVDDDFFGHDLCKALDLLSACEKAVHHLEEALVASRESVQIRRRRSEGRPVLGLSEFARSLMVLTASLGALNRHEEALSAIEESVGLYRKLVEEQRQTFVTPFAESLRALCDTLSALDRYQEAEPINEECVELHRQLAKERPTAHNSGLAKSLTSMAKCFSKLGRHEEALAFGREAVSLQRQLAKGNSVASIGDLAQSLESLANPLAALCHTEELLATLDESVGLYRQLAKDHPASHKAKLAKSLRELSKHLVSLQLFERALAPSRERVALYQELAAPRQREPTFSKLLAESYQALAGVLTALDLVDEARAASKEAKEIIELEDMRLYIGARLLAMFPGGGGGFGIQYRGHYVEPNDPRFQIDINDPNTIPEAFRSWSPDPDAVD